MTAPFKKGDRVVCVDSSDRTLIVEGRMYTIDIVDDDRVSIVGHPRLWFANRFRLVVEPPAELPSSWSPTHKGRAYAVAQAFGCTEAEAYGSDLGGHLDLLAKRERGEK